MLRSKLAYPLNDLKRIHKRDFLLGWRLVLHTRIIHVFDVYCKREDFGLKPPEARLTARVKTLRLAAGYSPILSTVR